MVPISEIRNPTRLGPALKCVRSDIDMGEKFGFVSQKYPDPETFIRIGADLGNPISN